MKAYDIYKRTCAIMFENEGEDKSFTDKFLHILNLLIHEALPYENSVREADGKPLLTFAPEVSDINDKVDMCTPICATALPYGVAAYFYQDDGESYSSAMYRERFVNALGEAARCNFRDITDVYGGETL
ncbi:MAG: hypothetical protein II996_02970 [Oscillospiraceae bacterium]|nr:hypothetical protein [Oscillospiraceae bacterium]